MESFSLLIEIDLYLVKNMFSLYNPFLSFFSGFKLKYACLENVTRGHPLPVCFAIIKKENKI